MKHVTIEPFTDDCAGKVADWLVSNDEATAWAGSNASFPMSPDQLLVWQADPDVFAFVGFQRNKLVAYGELWIDQAEQEIELARIIVRPSHRGIGIGRSFVEALVDKATDFGLQETIIRVVPENVRAIHCYESAGLERISPMEQDTFNQGQPRKYVWFRKSKRIRAANLRKSAKDD